MMRILVISDTHGELKNLKRILKEDNEFDLCVHLGDYENSKADIMQLLNCSVEFVQGNNDYDYGEAKEKLIDIGGYKVFMTHGHRYRLFMGVTNLLYAAQERQADIVMFGHVHSPCVENYGDILVINPGSLSRPRQANRKPSYIIMTIDEYDDVDFEIKYLED